MLKKNRITDQPIERTNDLVMIPDTDSTGRISGYAAVYDAEYVYHVVGPDGKRVKISETIARGAFTPELIARSDVKATINHSDHVVPLARSKNGSGTMTLIADERGLRFDLDPNPEMKQEIAAVKRGDLDQCSYRYIPDVEEVTKIADDHIRVVVRSIKTLHDICLATYPAYAETSARFETRTANKINELIPQIQTPTYGLPTDKKRKLKIEGARYARTI